MTNLCHDNSSRRRITGWAGLTILSIVNRVPNVIAARLCTVGELASVGINDEIVSFLSALPNGSDGFCAVSVERGELHYTLIVDDEWTALAREVSNQDRSAVEGMRLPRRAVQPSSTAGSPIGWPAPPWSPNSATTAFPTYTPSDTGNAANNDGQGSMATNPERTAIPTASSCNPRPVW